MFLFLVAPRLQLYIWCGCANNQAIPSRQSLVDQFPFAETDIFTWILLFLALQTREYYLRQPLARKTTALMTAMPAVMARNRACFPPYWRNQRPMFGAPIPARPCVSQTHRPNTRPRPEWVCLRHQIPFDLSVPFAIEKPWSLQLINTTGAFIKMEQSFEHRLSFAIRRSDKRDSDFWRRRVER